MQIINMENQQHIKGDEQLRLTILIILVCLATGSLLGLWQQQVMDFLSLLAWIHVKLVLWSIDQMPFSKYVELINEIHESLRGIEPYLNPNRDVTVGIKMWWQLHKVAGKAYILIYFLPACILVWASFGRRPDLVFRTKHTLDSLWKSQPIADSKFGFLDRLVTSRQPTPPIDSPPTGGFGNMIPIFKANEKQGILETALNPEEWLVRERIVPKTQQSQNLLPFNQEKADSMCAKLSLDGINEVFEDNIGCAWRGLEALLNYEKGLVAAQILHYGFNQKTGLGVLQFLASIFDRTYPDYDRFEKVLRNHRKFQNTITETFGSKAGIILAKEAYQHAWKNTAMVAITRLARKEAGVFPTANFLWLKLLDRTLWYSLNNAGNAVSSIESAGVHAHYRAEIQTNLPLVRKNVFQVSRSLLEDYLSMSPNQVARRKIKYSLNRPIGHKLREDVPEGTKSIELVD